MIELPPALLFCPADRPDRFFKAADRAPAVILDLEDAVAPADKPAARKALLDHPLDPSRTIVRINAFGTADFQTDLDALADTEYTTLMLAKAESTEALDALDGYQVIALCESAVGVLAAPAIAAHPAAMGLMWGAEDLVASLGGMSSRDEAGRYRDVARHARSAVLLAAHANGKAAVDAIHVAIDDLDGLSVEAHDAAASGFTASACIHPSQVAVILDAYRASEGEVLWARGVLSAAKGQGGVFRYEGRMIDEPVLRHAASVLRRS